MDVNENENREQAAQVLHEALKRMQALQIDASTAVESLVNYLASWLLQIGGEQTLLDIAAFLQRRALEQVELTRKRNQHFLN